MADSATVWVLNGPNLNLLGEREPDTYGGETLAAIEKRCAAATKQAGLQLEFGQTNHEGELVAWIEAREKAAGLAINAGAYAHTSVAVLDALRLLTMPIIEVHLSNIFAREKFRHHSYISPAAAARQYAASGGDGYVLAIQALAGKLKATK